MRDGPGLPDKRTLDCPHCGAPLEPIRWTTIAGLILLVGGVIAARQLLTPLLEPLLDWKTLAIALGLVAAHHLWALRKWKKGRREREAAKRGGGRHD